MCVSFLVLGLSESFTLVSAQCIGKIWVLFDKVILAVLYISSSKCCFEAFSERVFRLLFTTDNVLSSSTYSNDKT